MTDARTPVRAERGRNAERRGRIAEGLCVVRLWLTGWRVLARRHGGKRGSGIGEIDIVATRTGTLAFIEVKARTSANVALESVQSPQRARLQNAAEAFLARHPHLADKTVRFDVMILAGGWWPRRVADAWRPGEQ
ncbi:MAG: YraN family protein [Rhodospirillaceae bacterium]|nr:YraN family protein [Rhodospirillaceae bacterium]